MNGSKEEPGMRTKLWTLLAAPLLAVFAAAPPAHAWGSLGHRAVALVAQHRLTPRALDALRTLLGGEAGLDRIASCADGMLHAQTPLYDCGGAFTLPSDPGKATGPWHYIHLPIREEVSAASLAAHCPRGSECVSAQVRLQAATLADAGEPPARRREALMFLVHLVGDEHQPLHVADDSDANGNGKPIVIRGREKSLHSLWDDLAKADDWREQSSQDPAALAGELEREIQGEDVGPWTAGDFIADAALESHAIGRELIYPLYAKDQGRELGADYEEAMRPIIRRRLAMAGVRLAALLEGALGQGAQAPAPNMAVVSPGSRALALLQEAGIEAAFE